MKKGVFALWNGREYSYGRDSSENRIIVSDRFESAELGFEKSQTGAVYFRMVEESELDEIYSVKTYAIIKGIKCYVRKEANRKVLLALGEKEDAEKLHFEMVDRDTYEKWIFIDEVEKFIEEKNILSKKN